MESITSRFLGALLLVFMVAGDANAIPKRYFVPTYEKPAAAKAPAVRRAVVRTLAAKNAAAKRTTRKAVAYNGASKNTYANYQRRVPSMVSTGFGGNGDYLHQVGGNSRWAPGHTIRVYVAPGKSSYKNIVANAMNQWSRASGGRINWTLTGDPGSADYTIGWTSSQREVSTGTEAGLTTTDTMVDPYSGDETIDHARTSILTRYNGRPLSDREISETTLHEVGHALGLEGHSSNPRDIMYYAAAGQHGLTARDMNTIQRLYR